MRKKLSDKKRQRLRRICTLVISFIVIQAIILCFFIVGAGTYQPYTHENTEEITITTNQIYRQKILRKTSIRFEQGNQLFILSNVRMYSSPSYQSMIDAMIAENELVLTVATPDNTPDSRLVVAVRSDSKVYFSLDDWNANHLSNCRLSRIIGIVASSLFTIWQGFWVWFELGCPWFRARKRKK